MAEPPAKRARRTDSAAMWERNEGSANAQMVHSKSALHDGHERRRSRSRERERRRERSRSRERDYKVRERDRNSDRYRDHRSSKAEGYGHDRRDRDVRDRERSQSRERYNSKRDMPAKARERSNSPRRNGTSTRTRSPPRGPKSDRRNGHDSRSNRRDAAADEMQVDGPNGVPETDEDEDAQLRRWMGFTSFNTTQNKKVPGNDIYGVRKEKKTQYRQYMNRVGGFNRPLSPSRE